ncbi:MAG: GNAT family N-acetyltransferase [Magnetovibrionaceae bacterium]
MGTISVRAFEPADLDAVRDLYTDVWGASRSRAYDAWRYLEPPDGLIPAACAYDGEKCVAFYGTWPVKLRIGSTVILGAQSMDTMTHPDYQRKGLLAKTAFLAYELATARGFEVLYGFPNEAVYAARINHLNWDHTGDIPLWKRPIRPSGLGAVPGVLGPVVDGIAALWPKGGAGGFKVANEKPSAEDLDPLLKQWRAGKRFCRIERDQAWLDWRYADGSDTDYHWFTARDERGDLKAALCFGLRREGWGSLADNRARLTEMLGADEMALSACLTAAIDHARGLRASLMDAATNAPEATRALRRAGFITTRGAPFIVRALTARNLKGNIHNHAAWLIQGGDLDTF